MTEGDGSQKVTIAVAKDTDNTVHRSNGGVLGVAVRFPERVTATRG